MAVCVHRFGLLQNKNLTFNFSGHKESIGNVLYLIYITELLLEKSPKNIYQCWVNRNQPLVGNFEMGHTLLSVYLWE